MKEFLNDVSFRAGVAAEHLGRKFLAWARRNPDRACVAIVTGICALRALTPAGRDQLMWVVSIVLQILLGN